MNRALHHVWDDRERVFGSCATRCSRAARSVIWEPAGPTTWPRCASRAAEMAFQNLSEHVQGNHFLRPDEIAAAFHEVGLLTRIELFAEGAECVVVATRA